MAFSSANRGLSTWTKHSLHTAAVALRPRSPGVRRNFGNALTKKGRWDEAVAEYREAIRLNRDEAVPHYNLGNVLREMGELDLAIAEYKEAIRGKQGDAKAHYNLGLVLYAKGELDEAIAEHREGSSNLERHSARYHRGLGFALHAEGELDEAIAECREALRIYPGTDGEARGAPDRLDRVLASTRRPRRPRRRGR